MEPIWNLIISIATLIAILLVGYFQRERIKTLETTLSSQKSILDAVKIYFEIFKIDELKKYVSLSEENVKKEARKQIEENAHQMSTQMQKQASQTNESMLDLFNFVYALIVRIPQKARVELVNENLKNSTNKFIIMTYLSHIEDIYLQPPYLTFMDLILSANAQQKENSTSGK
jgi:hypothetical protein